MKPSSSASDLNKNLITQVVLEAKRRQKLGQIPFTYYYRKSGIVLGSYFCGDEEGEFVLFFNQDYPDSTFILEFIAQHCRSLNEEIFVYPLESKGIERYETVTQTNYSMVEL